VCHEQTRFSDRRLLSDQYLDLRRLSLYSGIGIRTLRSHLVRCANPLPCYRVGGKILVKPSEYDAWMLAFRKRGNAVLDRVIGELVEGL
jgi:hypothetical protein